MIKSLTFFFIAFLWTFPARSHLFDIYEHKLTNGITVLVVENHKAPIVKQMVWYKVGAVDEKLGKGGTAHLLEHLMFRGSKKIPDGDFNRIMQINGAESNAFTSHDYTAYHQNLDISKLELAMALEADRMQNLDFSDEAFLIERDIVFQERKQMVENNPLSIFYETLQKDLWQFSPYAKPVTGQENEILSLSKKDVMDFYKNYYTPENVVIVISGDIQAQTAFKLAEKYYGKIPVRPTAKKAHFPQINNYTQTKLFMKLPRVQLPRIVRRYIVDSYNTHPEKIYALSVLSAYLGEGDTSQIYKELVVKRKKAIGVSSSYDYAARGQGTFNFSLIPAQGVSTEELTIALDEAIANAIDNINHEKITKVKNKMLAGLIYLKDNPFDAAYIVGSLYTIGMSKEDIQNYADYINQVDAQSVRQAAQEIFTTVPMVEGVVIPQNNGEPNE